MEGGISQELQNKLYAQTSTPSGYTERLGKLKITGKFETGGRYGHLDAYRYQITITNAELLEWSPPPAATTVTPADKLTEAQIAAQKMAEDFVRNSSTFRFDGIEGNIALAHSDPGPTSAFRSWSYTFKFETLHSWHGDRTGQVLAEVITTHNATILVNLEKDFPSAVFGDSWKVMMAVCDDSWDMLGERDLPAGANYPLCYLNLG